MITVCSQGSRSAVQGARSPAQVRRLPSGHQQAPSTKLPAATVRSSLDPKRPPAFCHSRSLRHARRARVSLPASSKNGSAETQEQAEAADPVKGAVVTVFGATGRVGREAVKRLLDRGATVRAVVRSADKAKEALPMDDELLDLCVCDLSKPRDVEVVLNGASAAIWCVSLEENRPSPMGVLRTLLPWMPGTPAKATVDIIAEQMAKQSSGAKLVLLSSAAVTRTAWSDEKKARLDSVVDIPIVRLNPLGTLDAQREQEQRLRDIGVPYAIVRPTGLKGNEDWAPGRPILAQGDVAVGRANRQDVADVLLAAAFNDEATGKTFEMITLQGYAPPLDKFTAVFSRLLNDDQRKAAGEDLGFGETDPNSPGELAVMMQHGIMMQLLPGEIQDPTRLEMGRKYEEVDSGEVNRESGAAATEREKIVASGALRPGQ